MGHEKNDVMPANKTSSSKAGDQDNEPVFPDGKTGLPTLEDLPAEHRQVYDQTLADLGKEILKRFTWTRNGGSGASAPLNALLTGSTSPCRQKNVAELSAKR